MNSSSSISSTLDVDDYDDIEELDKEEIGLCNPKKRKIAIGIYVCMYMNVHVCMYVCMCICLYIGV